MLRRIWALCCSLKLAIYLASAATLLLMGGSLLIPFHATIFGSMDRLTLGNWLQQVAAASLGKTWWFYLAALLMVLFGLNTLCCFLDWLSNLRSRWRKSGEYLLHLGVVLVLIAYIWGNIAGWRHNGLQCQIGGLTALPKAPGYFIRVDRFQPVFDKKGPPLDMISDVSIFRGDNLLLQGRVQINQPLLESGLVVTPVSFGRQPTGYRMMLPDFRSVELTSGSRIRMQDGGQLLVQRFLPDARRTANGQVFSRGNQLANPAFELRYAAPNGRSWRGWYFIREQLPKGLENLGLRLRPQSPTFSSYSTLTVNYDPGAPLAAVGSGLMSIGVVLALISFYRKRQRHDRPEI